MFNVRVYGVLLNNNQDVLVSDLLYHEHRITKFCGGGLEFGEGTRECLVREFKEELGVDVEVGNHIYTTDFFQPSAFDPTQQIISIYYEVKLPAHATIPIAAAPFAFSNEQMQQHAACGECEVFRFIPLPHFGPEDVTLPIDKIVAQIIVDRHGKF